MESLVSMLPKGQLKPGFVREGFSCMRTQEWLSQDSGRARACTEASPPCARSICMRTCAQQVFNLRLLSPWLLILIRQRLWLHDI